MIAAALKTKTTRFAAVLAIGFGASLPLLAETAKMPAMDMTGTEALATDTPTTTAFRAANVQMHSDMAIEYTNNPDVDFIKSMIPHHQGAVAMAKILLTSGTDPEVRKLAEGVIAAQEAEIAWMQDWLAKNGG